VRIIFTIVCCSVALLSGCAHREFDAAFGLNDVWAAEKHLINLLEAEGFHNGFATINRRTSDGAIIYYAAEQRSGGLTRYALSASRNSPGAAALISIAGRISRDRSSA
jgi:hypothetical protein